MPRSIPLLIVLLAVCATPLPAQSVPLQGSFAFVPEESDDVAGAIRNATSRVNFALRGIARSRLRRTNAPYRTLTIAHTTADVTIIIDQRAPITSPSSGAPVEWAREDGEVFEVSTQWEGDRLRQTFVADDGERDNLFRLSPDRNTLTLEVTVTSRRLPEPLVYTLVFRRNE
jgi:hypothetical protein